MITIDEAKQILEDSDNQGMSGFNPRFKKAIQLGIEALKLIKKERKSPHRWFNTLLPGETED